MCESCRNPSQSFQFESFLLSFPLQPPSVRPVSRVDLEPTPSYRMLSSSVLSKLILKTRCLVGHSPAANNVEIQASSFRGRTVKTADERAHFPARIVQHILMCHFGLEELRRSSNLAVLRLSSSTPQILFKQESEIIDEAYLDIVALEGWAFSARGTTEKQCFSIASSMTRKKPYRISRRRKRRREALFCESSGKELHNLRRFIHTPAIVEQLPLFLIGILRCPVLSASSRDGSHRIGYYTVISL